MTPKPPADAGKPDNLLSVTVETPIPKGTRRWELAYQLDEAAVMRQYKPDPVGMLAKLGLGWAVTGRAADGPALR